MSTPIHERWNWNHSAASRPAVIAAPADEGELLAIVADTRRFPSPVRAAGHWHSLNRSIEADGGTQVEMTRFAGIRVDEAARTVTVGAGTPLVRIAEALLPDYQLPVMPEIGNATAGSVACCGTKDSSIREGPGQVSSAVVGMRIVTPDGARDVTDPDELRLLRSSYGLLGIVVAVTFRIEPVRVFEFSYAIVPVGRAASPADLLGPADGFLGFLLPYDGHVIVERRRELRGAEARRGAMDHIQNGFRKALWEAGGSGFASLLWGPTLPGATDSPALALVRARLSGPILDHLLRLVLSPVQFKARRADTMIEFESDRRDYFDFGFWAFPASRWAEVVRDYLAFCQDFTRRTGFRPSLPTEVYHIREDAASPLSVSLDGAVFTLDMVHHWLAGQQDAQPEWPRMNEEFATLAARHGARPLLNQTKALTRPVMDEVLRQSPALRPGWDRLRAGAIPRFMSGYFRSLGL